MPFKNSTAITCSYILPQINYITDLTLFNKNTFLPFTQYTLLLNFVSNVLN